MSLRDDINSCLERDLYPFHMPGHKRNPEFDSMNGLFLRDITEINGADDLHCPEGILLRAQQRAAALYGCHRAYFLVNGSTSGLLTAISAACPVGSTIIVARNCHKAVYNAIFLRNLKPVYVYPGFDEDFGINGSISPQDVRLALEQNPQAKAVVLTSPTYDGVVSDIHSLAEIAHAFDVPLIADAAHGAHHGLCDAFPASAVQLGADAAVVSLHKTLPSPTGTAMLLVNSNRIKASSFRRFLDVYETSSPSYLFLSSMDACIGLLETDRTRLFEQLIEKLNRFECDIRHLALPRVFCYGRDSLEKHPTVFAHDRSRLVVKAEHLAMNGFDLENTLRERFGIEAEMSYADCTVLLTSICDTQEGFDRLTKALLTLDREADKRVFKIPYPACPHPQTVLQPWEAELCESKMLPLAKSEGYVCREYVCAYPPGTPVLVPGERITRPILEYLAVALRCGAKLTGSSGRMPNQIDVCRDVSS